MLHLSCCVQVEEEKVKNSDRFLWKDTIVQITLWYKWVTETLIPVYGSTVDVCVC